MQGSRPLSSEEITRINHSFTGVYANRDRCLFNLGLNTGLRIGELLSLRKRDIYDNAVHVARVNTKGKTQAKTIPLNPATKSVVTAHIADLNPDDYLFAGLGSGRRHKSKSAPISRVQAYTILERAYKSARVHGKLGCHAMRKTFSHAIYEGTQHDLVATQRALFHADIGSTVKYLGFESDRIVSKAIMGLKF
jgi:integrase